MGGMTRWMARILMMTGMRERRVADPSWVARIRVLREALVKRVMSTELKPEAVTPEEERKMASRHAWGGEAGLVDSKCLRRHAQKRVVKSIRAVASLVNETCWVSSST